jgi:hypothetical protein
MDKDGLRGGTPASCVNHALISAHDATITTLANDVFEGSIDPYLCNVGGTLHGGAVPMILSNLTGEALHVAAREG